MKYEEKTIYVLITKNIDQVVNVRSVTINLKKLIVEYKSLLRIMEEYPENPFLFRLEKWESNVCFYTTEFISVNDFNKILNDELRIFWED